MVFRFGRSALAIGLAAALFAACAGGRDNPPLWNPMARPLRTLPSYSTPAVSTSQLLESPRSGYKLLYSFGSVTSDGRYPLAGLIHVNGTLYGTTSGGGVYGHLGTVFSLSTSGKQKVLHSFGKGTDGHYPAANLIDVDGTLYGTTESGGKYGDKGSEAGDGTVFSITTSGIEKVLHNFGKGTDGKYPAANLIDVDGTLYGTTESGGAYDHSTSESGDGTVFSITTSGTEKILHNFGKGTDGEYPVASLSDVKGTLYGTTLFGGTNGGGTVFRISTSGKEKALHSFGKGTDGSEPDTGLINVNGTLYGTTEFGGVYGHSGTSSGEFGGTVFSITTAGAEKVLHSFGKGSDGNLPQAGLIDVNGTLYGTTFAGGAYSACALSGSPPCGSVFSITTTGQEKVSYSFGKRGDADGVRPAASLTNLKGTLYGTTFRGGAYDRGAVFAFKP
jgi:uncharacterized repeat protein (TIGR03803 family)